MDDIDRVREDFIILLLGAKDSPVPTMWHVQKELFVLSKVNPKIQELFEFRRHYEGPYSESLKSQVEEPLFYDNPYTYDSETGGYYLLAEGRTRYYELLERYNNLKLKQLLNAFSLFRNLYDRLSKDELLFIMYITYPDFIELSNIYDRLKVRKKELAYNIYKKGLVTEKKTKRVNQQWKIKIIIYL